MESPSSTGDPEAPFPFSRLPAEIRRNIWRYCVSPQIIDIWAREECFVSYYQSSNQTNNRNALTDNLKANGPWIQKLTTCSQQRIPLHWICGESRLWAEQNSLYLSPLVHYDKVSKEYREDPLDVLRKTPRRVIFDLENDVLLLRRLGLSHKDICVLREEEETELKKFIEEKEKKKRLRQEKEEDLSEEEEGGISEEEEEELSEEEIYDDESEKLINDSEVIYRTMVVISTRVGFQAQRVRHIAMDYDSWNALYSCRFWQSLGQFEGLQKVTAVGKNQDDENVQSTIQAINRASLYSRVWGSVVSMPAQVFVETRRDLENNLEGLVELGTLDMENVDLGGDEVPWTYR
jgi:hypothetical protein